ncbi:MAG: LysR family transcriptional regulator [Burkholderiaceae bacterium]|nr:LysR family transcriptional regulator [Burkholderiaceae bacterium]
MDTLQTMKVFVRVAQRASFAAAGRDLSLSPASVTKQVAALEARVGARLLDRTTRRVGLTEAGRVYLDRCLECLQAFDDADASISALSHEPKGLLRIAAPVDLGNDLAPIIARLMNAHPQLRIELQLSNRPVDLVEEGIDLALRVAASLDGRYVARPVALARAGVFAAPAYLRQYGCPRKPEELARHRALVFLEPRLRDEWMFERDARSVRVKLDGFMTSNFGAALSAAGAAGAGVVIAPSFVTRTDVAAGRLQRLLPDWTVLPALHVYAIYPHRRFLAAKVKACIEALRTTYGDGTRDPWDLAASPPARAPRAKRGSARQPTASRAA